MSTLAWSPELALAQPEMDATHQEFIDLLARAEAVLGGAEAELLDRFETLVDHTVEHFGQEDRWMAATGFAPENCHSYQHQAVLGVMIECAKRAREERDFEPLKVAVGELAVWFPQHAQMMDAALAEHMKIMGFDPISGTCREAVAADGQPITGCGGASCS